MSLSYTIWLPILQHSCWEPKNSSREDASGERNGRLHQRCASDKARALEPSEASRVQNYGEALPTELRIVEREGDS
eukprot:6186142-Pleurochrysis_carterae.AAC.7